MVKNEESWRLLDFETPDPKMNLAVSEAIFRCKRAGLSPNTLYLWRTAGPIILFYSGSKHEILAKSVREQTVELLRTQAVAGDSFFCDSGNINFSVAVDTQLLEPRIEGEYRPLLSEYEFLLDGFAAGIRRLGVEVKAETDTIYTTAGQEIATAQPAWLSDVLLLQGTVYVNTGMEILKSAFKRNLTSLASELKKRILPEEVTDTVVQEFEKKLGMTFEGQGLTDAEERLATKLYDTKYGTDRWNVDGKAPFLSLTGETLVALYVANPPTSKCRQLIEMVNKAASSLMDEVKVVVWRRGLGAEQHPIEAMPPVIISLSKANILPAVVINGEVKFALETPLENQLREAIRHPDKFPDILGSLYKSGLRPQVR
jgi:lipoate-protein ligase A